MAPNWDRFPSSGSPRPRWRPQRKLLRIIPDSDQEDNCAEEGWNHRGRRCDRRAGRFLGRVADTSAGDVKNDCAFGNAGGSPAAIADQGSSLFGGVLGAVTSIAADATTQTNTANCNNLNITDVIDQDSNNKTKDTTKTMIEDSFNQDNSSSSHHLTERARAVSARALSAVSDVRTRSDGGGPRSPRSARRKSTFRNSRPVGLAEPELRVRRLPEQEAGQPLLARRADHEIGSGWPEV